MKKIIKFLILLFTFTSISFNNVSANDCTFSWTDWDITDVSKCLNDFKAETLVWNTTSWSGYALEDWFKSEVDRLMWNTALILWIAAVWALVYAWLLLQFSMWNDEKIKKAKNIIKSALFGFGFLMWAWVIVATIIQLIYSIF